MIRCVVFIRKVYSVKINFFSNDVFTLNFIDTFVRQIKINPKNFNKLMKELFEFFKDISEKYGLWTSIGLSGAGVLLYYIYFLIKTFPKQIQSAIDRRVNENNKEHVKAARKRKKIMLEVKKILSDLILETGCNRSLLFEFSNGTSNLAGLPFLFINATSESLSFGTQSVISFYQRLNICLFADFIFELESKGYFHVNDIESIKNTHQVMYKLLKQDNVTSMTAYAIYGLNDIIGYIVIYTTDGKIMVRNQVLPRLAEAAQRVSALLNLDDLEEIAN